MDNHTTSTPKCLQIEILAEITQKEVLDVLTAKFLEELKPKLF